MSRKSIAEYVAEKRRVYAKSGSAKRTRMIDEVCDTLGYTRKYVIKGLPRIKPFAVKFNRRSGLNRPILDAIECKSGEETMACDVRPGDTQIDTVAHCGGDMRGNFFWTFTQTDRNTQWTEITPTWNKGMHNTVEALKERYEQLNGLQLYQQVVRRLKRILRRQECWRDQQRQTQKLILEARLADFAPFNASINSFIFNH